MREVSAWSMRLLLVIACGGCAIPVRTSSTTTYHLIVAIGVVAVSDPEHTAAVVTRAQSLGVAVSDRPGLKLGVGYASSTVTSVSEGAEDVRIEAADRPFGPLTITVDKAALAPPATPAP
ncbi:hypothetical protein KF840_06675 [bacterium]|nr:hypothetical protein [bacterium]